MATSHMNPPEVVQAFLELGADHLVIVHWGSFRLGDEPVHFPPQDIGREIQKQGLSHRLIRLKHGQTFFFDQFKRPLYALI
jgi:L-ascorbate metabolism protein UlaG (beta-lactamase superfamily)